MSGSNPDTINEQDVQAAADAQPANLACDVGGWHTFAQGLETFVSNGGLRAANTTDEPVELRLEVPALAQPGVYEVSSRGYCTQGNPGMLYVVDHFNAVKGEVTVWSKALVDIDEPGDYAIVLRVPAHSTMVLLELFAKPVQPEAKASLVDECLTGSVAVIVPNYPTPENKYLCAFVHARVKAYRQANIACDVISTYDYHAYCSYEFEDVPVLRMPIEDLPGVLQRKGYKAVLVHFFDPKFAAALDAANLGDVPIVLWSHNPETQYWDWAKFASPYFDDPIELTDEQVADFKQRDEIIRRYNAMPNVSWVFITEAQQKRAEELIGVEFERAYTIPNLVDEQEFPTRLKSDDMRRRIMVVRKFDNLNTYAIDIDVAAIVELSKRPCFDELEFDIYGTGELFDKLVEPVRGFDNVRLHNRFLTRREIALAHMDHGVALFATRYDSQGVSMCEAAMSGLVVVSSKIPAAQTFLPDDQGILCDVEDAAQYADVIERFYNDPAYFRGCAQACAGKVQGMLSRPHTVNREIALIVMLAGNVKRPSLPSFDLPQAVGNVASWVKERLP